VASSRAYAFTNVKKLIPATSLNPILIVADGGPQARSARTTRGYPQQLCSAVAVGLIPPAELIC